MVKFIGGGSVINGAYPVYFINCVHVQGILGLLSAVLGTRFFLSCYTPVGEVMDLLALGNSAANFLLYCLMSTQFRATLAKMLRVEGKATPPVLTMGLPTTQV